MLEELEEGKPKLRENADLGFDAEFEAAEREAMPPAPKPASREDVEATADLIKQALGLSGIDPNTLTPADVENLRFSVAVLRDECAAADLGRKQAAACREWLLDHPEFQESTRNANLMLHELAENGLDGTNPKHYQYAYQKLTRAGKLSGSGTARPASSTGLSDRHQAAMPPVPSGDELQKITSGNMTLDERRLLMRRLMERNNQR